MRSLDLRPGQWKPGEVLNSAQAISLSYYLSRLLHLLHKSSLTWCFALFLHFYRP